MEDIETIGEFRKINPYAEIITFSGGSAISAGGYLKLAASSGAQYTFQKPISIGELKKSSK